MDTVKVNRAICVEIVIVNFVKTLCPKATVLRLKPWLNRCFGEVKREGTGW
jgi:hypothetical protein